MFLGYVCEQLWVAGACRCRTAPACRREAKKRRSVPTGANFARPAPLIGMGKHGSDAHHDVALARYLRSHDGAIGVETLRSLGFDKDAVTRLVKREMLIRVHRGAYRSGSGTPSNTTFLRCALLAVGPDAAIARVASAHHQGLLDFAPAQIELVVPRRSVGRTRAGLVVHETHDLPRRDLIVVDGVRCSNPMRTILDMASATTTDAELKRLRRAIRQATVRDKRLPSRLATRIDQSDGFAGSNVLRGILGEHLDKTAVLRSTLEAAFLDLLLEHGIPLPETNAIVEGFEVDAAWREQRVVVELDTYTYHGGVDAFEGDRARDAQLVVAGYRLIRITRRRLEREPLNVVRQTRSLLGI
jgi:predicted transcriptional regulator of viral defense system